MTLLYTHLSLAERCKLFCLHSAKIPMQLIARQLKRHPSTLYPEIKRSYFHVAAHAIAHGRRTSSIGRA